MHAVVLFGVLLWIFWYASQTAPKEQGPLTSVLRAGDPDYAWYAKYVQLESRGIKMGKSFADKRMVMFAGVVDNGGEKSLDVVEVKLTLFNYDQAVFEKVTTPIRPGRHTPPIRPLKRRAFTVYLEDLPGEWMASRAEMRINGFRFEKK